MVSSEILMPLTTQHTQEATHNMFHLFKILNKTILEIMFTASVKNNVFKVKVKKKKCHPACCGSVSVNQRVVG